jgi:adenine phosphoribosyltransferase
MPSPPEVDLELLTRHIRDVPDFPKAGIVFKDITPLCADPAAFRHFLDLLEAHARACRPDRIVAVDARGFVFGGALADRLGLGVVLVRKKGKLPAETLSADYELEYGTATVEMHRGSLQSGERVLLVDDLLATGGTVAAAVSLCQQQGAVVVSCAFLVELAFLDGRARLGGLPVFAPVRVVTP